MKEPLVILGMLLLVFGLLFYNEHLNRTAMVEMVNNGVNPIIARCLTD